MSKTKVVSFLSAPGGVGKTTITLCASWFMRERNIRPLIFDMDPSLGLTLSLMDFYA